MSYTAKNPLTNNNRILVLENRQQEINLINAAMKTDKQGNIINQEEYAIFYNQYNRFVSSIANKILHDEDEAEDVTHEILIKLILIF